MLVFFQILYHENKKKILKLKHNILSAQMEYNNYHYVRFGYFYRQLAYINWAPSKNYNKSNHPHFNTILERLVKLLKVQYNAQGVKKS